MTKELSTRDKRNAIECIREFMNDRSGRVELSDTVHAIYARLRAAWTFMSQDFKSREQTIKELSSSFGVSEAQAKRDVLDCMSLWGNVYKTDVEASRAIASEMAMYLFGKAKDANDVGGMNDALKSFIKLNQLDKEQVDKPDYTKLEATMNIIVADDSTRHLVQKLLQSQGTIDLNTITDDIEFEYVTPENEQTDNE
jgi:hypothetical protein